MSTITVKSTGYHSVKLIDFSPEMATHFHAINGGVTINLENGESIGTRDNLHVILEKFSRAVSPDKLQNTPVRIEKHVRFYHDGIMSVQKDIVRSNAAAVLAR